MPEIPGVPPSGAPLSEDDCIVKATIGWRLNPIGAQEAWAGRDWEQSPPPLESFATPIQQRAWRLKMGLVTEYAYGSTPEQIFQASQLIWNEGFGCLRLFEDALAYSPACQFFSRDGNGICVGTALKMSSSCVP